MRSDNMYISLWLQFRSRQNVEEINRPGSGCGFEFGRYTGLHPGSTCGHPTACRHSIDNAAQRLSRPTARKPSVHYRSVCYSSDSSGDTHISTHAHDASYTCGHANSCTDQDSGSHADEDAGTYGHSHSNTDKYGRTHRNSHDPADEYAGTYANAASDADRCSNRDTCADRYA